MCRDATTYLLEPFRVTQLLDFRRSELERTSGHSRLAAMRSLTRSEDEEAPMLATSIEAMAVGKQGTCWCSVGNDPGCWE